MDHPYKRFEGTLLWDLIDQALTTLEENGDFIPQTARHYLVGYLCQRLQRIVPRTHTERVD